MFFPSHSVSLRREQEGDTALLVAARGRAGAVIEKLLDAGADINHKNKVRHLLCIYIEIWPQH